MKVALLGYGKMGKAIENILLHRGHEVMLRINSSNANSLNESELKACDVAIEFSGPENAFHNLSLCARLGVPVVCGSTGWLNRWNDAVKMFEKDGALLYASNFSVGVNVFFEINKKLASLLSRFNAYDVSLEEIHHTAKKDAPSGTAITLAEQIINVHPTKNKWVCDKAAGKEDLVITAKREDPAPGTHEVKWSSDIDDIQIIHTAHNRKGFANGAVLAAEYIIGKKGILSMHDVLGF